MSRTGRRLLLATVTATLLAVPSLPRAAVQDDLDRIAIYGVESARAERGPWLQMYAGTGEREVNVFLDGDFSDYEIRTADLDGDGKPEIVALGTELDEGRAQLQVRRPGGARLDREAALEGEIFERARLLLFEASGVPYVGVVGADVEGAVDMEIWHLQGSGGTAALVRDGRVELLPSGSAEPLLEAGDLDGDGSDEIVAVYPNSGGRGVRVRALDALTGEVRFDVRAFPGAFDSPALVVGDFRPESAGREVLVGAQRRGNRKGFLRVLDGDGKALIRRGAATPVRVDELSWTAIAAPDAGSRLLLGYRNRRGAGQARVYDLGGRRSARRAMVNVCPAEMQLVAGDFDGDPETGGEIGALCVLPDRSGEFRFFAHDGTAGATGEAFDATAHSPQIAVRRAVDPDRDDLMIAAVRNGSRPEVALVKHGGTVLLKILVFSPGVQ